MSCNFIGHGAFVHQHGLLGGEPDGPDPVNLMPWAFVTEHEQIRISSGELYMIEPC